MTLDEAYHKLRIQTEQLKSSEPSAVKPVSPNTWKKFQPDWKENYEKLCRGEKDVLQVCSVLPQKSQKVAKIAITCSLKNYFLSEWE